MRVLLLLVVVGAATVSVMRFPVAGAGFTASTSSDGNQFTAAASFALDAPGGVSASPGWEAQVPVEWDGVVDAEEYQVRFRLEGEEEWSQTGWTADNDWSVGGLTNNEVYEFQVAGRNPLRVGLWGPQTPLSAMPRQWAQVATSGGQDPGPPNNWYDPSASDEHTCAVTVSGRAYCWGDNRYGQLGIGADTPYVSTPIPVDTTTGLTDTNVVAITAGWHHTCAQTTDGQAYCWGRNNSGQLGDGTTTHRTTPTAVATTTGLTSTNVAQIAAGGWHTCAVTTAGKAYCWGWNGGTLGDGTTTQRTTPTAVATTSGLTDTNVSTVTVGDEHTCAVTTAGRAYCWGRNTHGQLGDGTTTQRTTPRAVTTTTGLTTTNVGQLSAGGWHTCAVTTAGRAYCWGVNWNGQLGDGTEGSENSRNTPTPVVTTTGLTTSNVASLTTGTHHTCAVTSDGEAYCWGRNLREHLGVDDDALSVLTPTAVVTSGTGLTGTNVADLSAGYKYTCALTTAGRVYCWGRNDSGQLGDGTTDRRETAIRVSANTAVPLWSPEGVSADSGLDEQVQVTWDAVADAEEYQVRYRLEGDSEWVETAWASDTVRTIGSLTNHDTYEFSVRARNPLVTSRWAPDPPVTATPRQWAHVDAGGDGLHTCAVTVSGRAYCWGRNNEGQLGDGTTTQRTTPTPVVTTTGLTATNVASINAGRTHTCAVTTDGQGYCWGQNIVGQLGDGSKLQRTTPTPVATSTGLTDTNVAAITATRYRSCAVTTDGKAFCWGYNLSGQLGDGTTTERTTPTAVDTSTGLTDTNVASITAAEWHTCAVTIAGKAYCWGRNTYGTLGDDTTEQRTTPTAVATSTGLTDTNVASITAGGYRSCAVTTAGKAYCWGWNGFGGLGDGTTDDKHTPTAVSTATGLTDTNVSSISTGFHHTCALTADGVGWCWGRNLYGELGDGTSGEDNGRLTPTRIQ